MDQSGTQYRNDAAQVCPTPVGRSAGLPLLRQWRADESAPPREVAFWARRLERCVPLGARAGAGRVRRRWVRLGPCRRFPRGDIPANRVIGVELEDEQVALARRIFDRNPRVEIRGGDVENVFPSEATIFYVYPPSDGKLTFKLKALIDRHATGDTVLVARGALGDLASFRGSDLEHRTRRPA